MLTFSFSTSSNNSSKNLYNLKNVAKILLSKTFDVSKAEKISNEEATKEIVINSKKLRNNFRKLIENLIKQISTKEDINTFVKLYNFTYNVNITSINEITPEMLRNFSDSEISQSKKTEFNEQLKRIKTIKK